MFHVVGSFYSRLLSGSHLWGLFKDRLSLPNKVSIKFYILQEALLCLEARVSPLQQVSIDLSVSATKLY